MVLYKVYVLLFIGLSSNTENDLKEAKWKVMKYLFWIRVITKLPNSEQSYRGNKGNNKITELRTILQRESQNS